MAPATRRRRPGSHPAPTDQGGRCPRRLPWMTGEGTPELLLGDRFHRDERAIQDDDREAQYSQTDRQLPTPDAVSRHLACVDLTEAGGDSAQQPLEADAVRAIRQGDVFQQR